MNKAFPFEMVLKEDKKLFVSTVEEVLKANLQEEKSFGCLISDCHMHVGSKKHLGEFVEAELLFHNSYYNKRFALLTIMFLEEKISKYEKVFLVGYETFCELYLRETIILLREKYPEKSFHYCIIETIGEKIRVRDGERGHYDGNSYYAFIVPLSTTLTTHDKLMSTFMAHIHNKNVDIEFSEKNSCNIALIIIAPMEENDYWEHDVNESETIVLKKEKRKLLKALDERKVHYFVSHCVKWEDATECEKCYPDLNNGFLIEEKPIFEVNKGSVVPMLQLGINRIPEPLIEDRRELGQLNLKKVICLSKYMFHHHIVRNGNHYQYHFDTQGFFEEVSNLDRKNEISLNYWLDKIVKKKVNNGINILHEGIVYNFLVAPRHYSNAGFVQCVNDIVFNGTARILYFDTAKEYRDNIKAKYSDFLCLVNNILESKQPSSIRFHYVDDTIYSGANFVRTKSLIRSLVHIDENKINNDFDIQLFATVIVLVGRNSLETKRDYVQTVNNFYEYVHVSVSPMRNHGDACILCQLVNQYKFLEKCSSTNQMAKVCRKTIKSHKKKKSDNFLQKIKKNSGNEKRLRLILRHLLAETLNNNWWLNNSKEKLPINAEDADSIYITINIFYEKMYEEFKTYCDFTQKEIRGALIKVITRPFFTFHIRRRQAAFRFCIEKLEEILNREQPTMEDKYLFGVLINGLADMNANYLIRLKSINRILCFIHENKTEFNNICYYKAIKRVVGVSADDSKGLLLEHILVEGTEEKFFNKCMGNDKLIVQREERIALYIENNSVLIAGFNEIYKQSDFKIEEEFPYYLKKFDEIFSVNQVEAHRIIPCYITLREFLENGNRNIHEIGEAVRDLFPNMNIQVFLRDENEDSKRILWEKYYYLGQDKKQSKEFYSKSNLNELEEILARIKYGTAGKAGHSLADENKIIHILDTLYYDNNCIIVKIGDDLKGNIYFKITDCDKVKRDGLSLEENLALLFSIKVLLTLRNAWIKYFEKSNLPNVKRQLNDEKNKKALVIRKAAQHHQMEIFEGNTVMLEIRRLYYKIQEEFQKKVDFELIEQFKEAYKMLADKYVQLLANDYISYVYRTVVCFPVTNFYVKPVFMGNKLQEYLKKMGFIQNLKGEFCYTICMANQYNKEDALNRINGEMKVNIIWNVDSFKESCFWFLKTGGAKLQPYYLLTMVMAGNAGYHYITKDGKGECHFKVWAEGKYMMFSNELAEYNLSESEQNKIRADIIKKKEYPPWECNVRDQSITLWTLEQYFERAKTFPDVANCFGNENDWIKIKVTEKYYTLGLKILDRRDKGNGN